MGLCSSNMKYSESSNTQMENIKPKIMYFKLSQANEIYETVLTAFINKKSIPDRGGIVFMRRNDKSHITMRLLPGIAPSDDPDAIDDEILIISRLIEDHLIDIGVKYELYIDKRIKDLGCYKLYCHIFDKA